MIKMDIFFLKIQLSTYSHCKKENLMTKLHNRIEFKSALYDKFRLKCQLKEILYLFYEIQKNGSNLWLILKKKMFFASPPKISREQ